MELDRECGRAILQRARRWLNVIGIRGHDLDLGRDVGFQIVEPVREPHRCKPSSKPPSLLGVSGRKCIPISSP